MYIKNIFDVVNYKGLPDGYSVEFDDVTYIIGDNAKNKTTIGSLPLWILTGYNMYGGNKEQVLNDNIKGAKTNVCASMTIIDNDGNEQVITRVKGKENFVMLNEIRTTQEMLTKFYKEVHAFICSYNPSYFKSLKPMEQKDLLLRILPAISTVEAFNLLEKEEKEILEKPISDVKGFCKARRADIKKLKSDLDRIEGNKDIYIKTAIETEEKIKDFTRQQELNSLESEYERLISNSDNIINFEDLEKDISRLEQKLKNNINIELKELQEKQKLELEKYKNINDASSKCPTCKQEIKNENMIRALKISYKNSINNFAKKIENLKIETKDFMEQKKRKVELYEKMKNPEIQEQNKRKIELKEKIDILIQEKKNIEIANNEAIMRNNQIASAKSEIKVLDKQYEECQNLIQKYENQIKVANRLYLLMISKQMEGTKGLLNNVSIEFSKIDENTGEILDVYEIYYKGRKYEKLSKSYKMKADIEISNLINKLTGINTPVFIDDVESITQIDLNSETQIIIALVIKYNELEVLYDYQKVLLRERDSINKKIEESSNLVYLNAV